MLSIPNGGNPNVGSAPTTANSTANTTTAHGGAHNYLYDKYDYDLYVDMYEYFGGTTANTNEDDRTTKKTERTTTARTTNGNGGWGGWGYSG